MRFNVRANYNGTYPENVLTASASYIIFAAATVVTNVALNQGSFIHNSNINKLTN